MNEIVKNNIINDLEKRKKELQVKQQSILKAKQKWGVDFNLAKLDFNPRLIEIELKYLEGILNSLYKYNKEVNAMYREIDKVKETIERRFIQ